MVKILFLNNEFNASAKVPFSKIGYSVTPSVYRSLRDQMNG